MPYKELVLEEDISQTYGLALWLLWRHSMQVELWSPQITHECYNLNCPQQCLIPKSSSFRTTETEDCITQQKQSEFGLSLKSTQLQQDLRAPLRQQENWTFTALLGSNALVHQDLLLVKTLSQDKLLILTWYSRQALFAFLHTSLEVREIQGFSNKCIMITDSHRISERTGQVSGWGMEWNNNNKRAPCSGSNCTLQ